MFYSVGPVINAASFLVQPHISFPKHYAKCQPDASINSGYTKAGETLGQQ
jgi:hypothetical protein